jgi:hypothetical protein
LQDTSVLGDSVPLTPAVEPVVVVEEEREGGAEEARGSTRQEEGRRKLIQLMENVEGGRSLKK